MKLSLQYIKKKTYPLVWLLLGLLLLYPMAQHAVSGIVLCIGIDGHIEIEDGRASDCATQLGKAVAETHFEHDTQDEEPAVYEDCGPCIDVALFTSPLDGQRLTRVDVSVTPDFTHRLTTEFFLQFDNQVASLQPDAKVETPQPFFSPLRTISLLI